MDVDLEERRGVDIFIPETSLVVFPHPIFSGLPVVFGRCCRDGDVASGRSLFSARNDPFAHISDI